jgi:hypothetical protein
MPHLTQPIPKRPVPEAQEVQPGFWSCCRVRRPAYALAFDADDGSTVWHWACSSCTHGAFGQDAAAKIAASDRVIARAAIPTNVSSAS